MVLQTISFITISSQVSKIDTQQQVAKEDVDNYVSSLREEIQGTKQENQFKINEISRQIAQQGEDIQGKINLLKAGQDDFSGIIDEVIRGVVNVGTDTSAGTGFVVNPEGYIVTNDHVIRGGSFVRILTFDGREFPAEVLGTDPVADVALLKVNASFDSLDFVESKDLQVGENVIAIGNPLGLSFTVTEGIISALNRAGPNGIDSYVQTDVTLNPGNSGGPLINKEGKVIGINNFKIGNAESLGFALESDVVVDVVNLIANETLIG